MIIPRLLLCFTSCFSIYRF